MNFAFYISGNGGRTKKILKNRGKYLSEIKLIVSDTVDNADIVQYITAQDNIKYVLIEYNKIEDSDKNESLSESMLKYFQFYHIDYCFSFGDHILKGRLLEEYKNKIINFHPSLLPMFRGRNAIDQAINSNTLLLGCSAHFIDVGVDTGPIIMQSVMSRYIFDGSNYDAILDTQIVMLEKIIELLEESRISIVDGRVCIEGANYDNIEFFPQIIP